MPRVHGRIDSGERDVKREVREERKVLNVRKREAMVFAKNRKRMWSKEHQQEALPVTRANRY